MKFFQQRNEREKKLLILALIIIGGVSLYRWGVSPFFVSYQSLNRKIEQREHELREQRMQLNSVERYQEHRAESEIRLKKLNSVLLNYSEEQARVEFLKTLERIVKAAGLQIESKEIYQEKSDEIILQKLVSRLELRGNIVQLTEFLQAIQEEDNLFTVNELQLRQIEGSGKININLTIEAYNGRGYLYELE